MENGHEPATKADMTRLGEQLRSEFQHGFDDLKETMRDMQTEMLKAFYGFAQSTDAKLKETELADIMLRQRLTAVESRLTEVEKRILTTRALWRGSLLSHRAWRLAATNRRASLAGPIAGCPLGRAAG